MGDTLVSAEVSASSSPSPTGEQESDYRRDFGELRRVEFRRSSWTACIKRIYEVDPLESPKCKEQMLIIPLRRGYGGQVALI